MSIGTPEGLSDEPRELRAEDSFDVDALQQWVHRHVPDMTVDNPHVRQFPGGASNLTYLLSYPDREVILRRPPAGTKAASAHDMKREFTIQDRLRPTFGQVPTVLALCTDESVIGSEFYLMERVPGVILRGNLPPGLTLSAAQARSLSESMVDTLVALHEVDVESAGIADLGKGGGYVARQVGGWSRRFRAARTDNVPDFEDVMSWLDSEQPDDVGYGVVHGDFRMDNLVLNPDGFTVTALLDWELATLGDPLMDLGSAMAYWVQADDDEGMQMTRHLHAFFVLGPGRRRRGHADGASAADQPAGHAEPERVRGTVLRRSRSGGRQLDLLRGVRTVPARSDRATDLLPVPPRADDQPGVRTLLAVRGLRRAALSTVGGTGHRLSGAARVPRGRWESRRGRRRIARVAL